LEAKNQERERLKLEIKKWEAGRSLF